MNFRPRNLSALSAFTVIAAVSISAPACAQSDFDDVQIKAEPLAPGVAVLFGAGGNIGISYGEDGTVLIDDQFAPLTGKIQSAISDLGASPVKFLINTHWHGDHSGGNENLGKAGAVIMAHDNVRIRMATEQNRGGRISKPSPKIALPVVTYDAGLKLHLNGEEVRVVAVAPGHTDGDSVIHWTASNVFHMGDLFFNGKETYPYIDLDSGGNAHGLVGAADMVLALADENSKIIPGHGPVASKADLQEYRDMVAAVVAKVEAGVKAGKNLQQIQAERPADGYGIAGGGFIKADDFVTAVYKSVGGKN